jgi:hypothetical protein
MLQNMGVQIEGNKNVKYLGKKNFKEDICSKEGRK